MKSSHFILLHIATMRPLNQANSNLLRHGILQLIYHAFDSFVAATWKALITLNSLHRSGHASKVNDLLPISLSTEGLRANPALVCSAQFLVNRVLATVSFTFFRPLLPKMVPAHHFSPLGIKWLIWILHFLDKTRESHIINYQHGTSKESQASMHGVWHPKNHCRGNQLLTTKNTK